MKGIKNYLLAVVISLTTVSLYGNPEIALYRISEEVKNHTVQRSVLAFIRQIFEAIDRGEVLSAEDFDPLLPKQYSVKSMKYDEKYHYISVECLRRDIPFELLLERNEVAVYQKLPGCTVFISLLPLRAGDGEIDIFVPSEKQRLLRYAYGHCDVFFKHLYELLNEHARTSENTDPFAIRMRDAFEQSGYSLIQPVKDGDIPPFAINAENMYAFLTRWCMREKRKGRSISAMTTDVEPLYLLLMREAASLCPRVRELFEPTVFAVVNEFGESYLQIGFPRETVRKKCRILAVQKFERIGKYVLFVSAEYLGLPFRIKLEQTRRVNRKGVCRGCDRVEAEYLHD